MRSVSVTMYGRQVALVELQALGELELHAVVERLLDGDDAVLADLVERLGDDLADGAVLGGDGGHVGDVVVVVDLEGDVSSRASETASTAASMPRLRPAGEAPAATLRRPSCTMAWASTVAVVVPSPATSLVLVATSLASCAPRFSYRSSSSTSRAMVTPSLVMMGAPNVLSMTTLRPFGPSVTLTAFASASTPRSSAWRALSSNYRVLVMWVRSSRCSGGAGGAAGGACGCVERRRPGARPAGGRTSGARQVVRGRAAAGQASTIARTSRADRIRNSSPPYLTSVPPYLL